MSDVAVACTLFVSTSLDVWRYPFILSNQICYLSYENTITTPRENSNPLIDIYISS
jgi:hypothetical protein